MAKKHARSTLAVLAAGAALAVTGCSGGAADDTPASVKADSNKSRSQAGDEDSGAVGQKSEQSDAEASSGKPAAKAGQDTRPPWCTTGSLSVSLRAGQPAAGNRYSTLVLTNDSDGACRTKGYPGLQLTDGNGGKLPTETVRDDSVPSRALTLGAGESATARLHWTVVPGEGDPADGKCPQPAKLRVIPPDQRTATDAAWKLGAVCGAGEIDIRPLSAG